jgi:hypothetical protein
MKSNCCQAYVWIISECGKYAFYSDTGINLEELGEYSHKCKECNKPCDAVEEKEIKKKIKK